MEEHLLKKKLARRVLQLRTAMGLTQEDLATSSTLTVEAISRIERCEREPRLSTLARLAAGLNVSLSQLLDFERAQPFVLPVNRDVQTLLETLKGKPAALTRKITKITKVLIE